MFSGCEMEKLERENWRKEIIKNDSLSHIEVKKKEAEASLRRHLSICLPPTLIGAKWEDEHLSNIHYSFNLLKIKLENDMKFADHRLVRIYIEWIQSVYTGVLL